MAHKFSVGDRIRAMDFRHRTDCYVEVVIRAVLPDIGMYAGKCVRDVFGGEELSDGERTGFWIRCPMEGKMHRDWEERLAKV